MPSFFLPEVDMIFLHNPKTAGRLIRQAVWKKDIKGPFQGYIPEIYQNKFKFCFVRNPYDRLVSSWRHCIKSLKENSKLKEISLHNFFDIAINNLYIDEWNWRATNSLTKEKQSFALHHSLPQAHPFYMLNQANFYGKFENLQHDFDKLCEIRKIKKIILPEINQYKTNHLHFSEYFKDKNLLDKVNKYYKKDFELFDYEIMN
jgi:hypothetical protein